MREEEPAPTTPTPAKDYGHVEMISNIQEFSFVEGWYELTADSAFLVSMAANRFTGATYAVGNPANRAV